MFTGPQTHEKAEATHNFPNFTTLIYMETNERAAIK